MTAISDLDELLATMRPELDARAWLFVTDAAPLDGAIVAVVEREGVTSVVPVGSELPASATASAPLARLTLSVHSDLEAVGLTAAIAAALAARGIPANVVAGFLHDHVFVPAVRGAEALAALEELSERSRAA